MAGRKPIVDDRKKHPVTMYVSDEELDTLDKYVKEQHESTRAWMIRKVVFAYLNEELVPSRNVLFVPESARLCYKDIEFCKQFLGDESNLNALRDIKRNIGIDGMEKLLSIMRDKEKSTYLMSYVNDSKYLGGE